jgi:hypothetical protein
MTNYVIHKFCNFIFEKAKLFNLVSHSIKAYNQ